MSQSQWQSRITKTQDKPSIKAEITNNHGSNQSGIKYDECATSGANKLKIANTIGNTQQNRCGNNVAIIPNLTALFFILFFFIKLCLVSPAGIEPASEV